MLVLRSTWWSVMLPDDARVARMRRGAPPVAADTAAGAGAGPEWYDYGVCGYLAGILGEVRRRGDIHGRIRRTANSNFSVTGWNFPAFALMVQGSIALTVTWRFLVSFWFFFWETTPSTLPSLFPTHLRYGGFTISYNLSTSAFGGTAPYIITALIAALHTSTYRPPT